VPLLDSVRILTTIGVCALAIVRNVLASMVPTIGLLFMGGAVDVCADDDDDKSSRDVTTIPIAIDTTPTNTME
jgi:hypothetical protein